jgi:hypothetical protein
MHSGFRRFPVVGSRHENMRRTMRQAFEFQVLKPMPVKARPAHDDLVWVHCGAAGH